MNRQKIWSTLGAAVALALVASACSSSDDGKTAASTTIESTTTSAPTTTTMANSDTQYPAGLHNVRYCEILLLRKVNGNYQGEVWNTLGESTCPQAEWDKLDAAAIAKDRGALIALKNGPRYWLMDSILSNIRKNAETTKFETIGMFKAATVDLGPKSPVQTPYTIRTVNRTNIFRFKKGNHIHELVATDGTKYVMQTYATFVDPSLTVDNLDALGSRLKLPTGWKLTSRTLTEDLDVYSNHGEAFVIQDELQNTYQRFDPDAKG